MGRCTGKCKGDRGATDSPAEFALTSEGVRTLYCPCCSQALVPVRVDFSTGAPNVRQEITRRERRFEDKTCGYDVVVLKDLK